MELKATKSTKHRRNYIRTLHDSYILTDQKNKI